MAEVFFFELLEGNVERYRDFEQPWTFNFIRPDLEYVIVETIVGELRVEWITTNRLQQGLIHQLSIGVGGSGEGPAADVAFSLGLVFFHVIEVLLVQPDVVGTQLLAAETNIVLDESFVAVRIDEASA